MELSYAKLSGILWYILHQKKLAVRYDQQSVILHQKKLAVRYDQQSEAIEIFSDNSKQIFPFLQIEHIQHKEGIFWSSLSLKALDKRECHIKGLPKSKTRKFFHSLESAYELYWKEFLQSNDRLIQHLANQASDFDAGKFFVSDSMAQKIISEIKRLGFPLPLPINILNDRQRQDIQILNRFINNFDRQRINQKFIPLELERFKTFFDNIEANPLTEKQRLAVIVNEDANLVVAGAGSGKTSIIIAKAVYILKKGLCNHSEILLLAYSNKAKKELEQRLEQRLDNDINKHISVKTFHSLGLDIITRVNGTPPLYPIWQQIVCG